MNRKVAEDWLMKMRPLTACHSMGMIPCGSYRRGHESIGDLDIVVIDGNIPAIIERVKITFTDVTVVRVGEKIGTVKVGKKTPIQIEFYFTDLKSLGATLLYATGSGNFNQSMRALAKKKGWKLNQYGLWNGEELLAATSEERIFQELGLDFIPPDKRDGTVTELYTGGIAPKGNMMIAKILGEIADGYTKAKEPWRAKSFDAAAATIKRYSKPIKKVEDLEGLPGIGPSISQEIMFIINTGESPRLKLLKGYFNEHEGSAQQ